MKVKLTTIFRDPDILGGLRTPEAVGDASALPAVGDRFSMVAPPLDPTASLRYISTSPVREVKERGKDAYTLITRSGSEYHLDILPD